MSGCPISSRCSGPSCAPARCSSDVKRQANAAFPEELGSLLASEYAATGAALRGFVRKCLVLDLDDTLWGGVVGEVGPEGIQVGASYPGNIYRAIQQAARRMHEDGVLLALNSLNNEGDVWQAFELSRPRFSSSAISRRLSALSRQLIRQAEKCAARGPGPSAATPDCPGSHPAAVV
jgi:hypothetical protein